MNKILAGLLLVISLSSVGSAQELFTELRAPVVADGPAYTFRVLGDREPGAFSAYGLLVIGPDGQEQMLDQFDALLPDGSEVDALYVEDVNFDGYADLRVMKYLPGGANVPYFFWLYNPSTAKFEESKAFEVVMSPQVDLAKKELISRQRVSAAEYVTEYYKPRGNFPVLVRREERVYESDGSSVLKVFEITGGEQKLVETKKLPPQN